MNIKFVLIILIALAIPLDSVMAQRNSQTRDDTISVRPKEINDVFNNPGKGFMTFQRFNGDTLNPVPGWTEGFPIEYQDFDGNLENENYPQTTIAYYRVYWRYLEPEEEEYNWDLIDKALATAHERGQTLMLRIPAYGSGTQQRRDVPDWYREMVGERRDWNHENPVNKWVVDAEDPRYAKYYGGMIRALGERYDGHPDLESIDTAIVGAWGEGGGSALLTQKTREALVSAYTDSFKETPLVMLLADARTNQYGLSQADVGYRLDCLGDIGFWSDTPDANGWTHMLDYYPRSIIESGLMDAWKKAPVTFEICGTFTSWKESYGIDDEEVQFIFDEALRWGMSSFNAKSSPVPEEWRPMVDEWIKKMGYRYVVRKFGYPKVVAPNGEMFFTSWWINKGVSPIYRDYLVAFRFRNSETTSRAVLANADIREWLPGDFLYDDKIYVPDIPEGEYTLEMALVTHPLWEEGGDPEPAIRLAIEGRTDEGWYPMGEVSVKLPY